MNFYLVILAILALFLVPGIFAAVVEKVIFKQPPETEFTEASFKYFIVKSTVKVLIYTIISYLFALLIFQNIEDFQVFDLEYYNSIEDSFIFAKFFKFENFLYAFGCSILNSIILSLGWSVIFKFVINKN